MLQRVPQAVALPRSFPAPPCGCPPRRGARISSREKSVMEMMSLSRNADAHGDPFSIVRPAGNASARTPAAAGTPPRAAPLIRGGPSRGAPRAGTCAAANPAGTATPYNASPRMGQPRKERWARTWWRKPRVMRDAHSRRPGPRASYLAPR